MKILTACEISYGGVKNVFARRIAKKTLILKKTKFQNLQKDCRYSNKLPPSSVFVPQMVIISWQW